MLNILLPGLISIADKIFDRVIPDKAAAEKAKLEFLVEAQKQDFSLLLEQMKVNQAEAATGSLFVGGWRPFVGWVCGVALAYTYILLPLLQFAVFTWGTVDMVNKLSRMPVLALAELLPILLGMLGLAGYRTIEKVKEVAKP